MTAQSGAALVVDLGAHLSRSGRNRSPTSVSKPCACLDWPLNPGRLPLGCASKHRGRGAFAHPASRVQESFWTQNLEGPGGLGAFPRFRSLRSTGLSGRANALSQVWLPGFAIDRPACACRFLRGK